MKPAPAGILNAPKAPRNSEVSFKQPKVAGDSGLSMGVTPDHIGKAKGLNPLSSAGSLSPKGPDARRSESVGAGPTKGGKG